MRAAERRPPTGDRIGVPFRVIAAMLGISLTTLKRHFRVELTRGRDEVVAAIGGGLVRAALGGNVHAMRYWLMCRGGPAWRPVTGVELGALQDGEVPPILVSRAVPWPRIEDEGSGGARVDENPPSSGGEDGGSVRRLQNPWEAVRQCFRRQVRPMRSGGLATENGSESPEMRCLGGSFWSSGSEGPGAHALGGPERGLFWSADGAVPGRGARRTSEE